MTHVERPFGKPARRGHLTNTELGDRLGLTASAASLLRRGKRGPGFKVKQALVKNLGADWVTMFEALVKLEQGDRATWWEYMQKLCKAAATDR